MRGRERLLLPALPQASQGYSPLSRCLQHQQPARWLPQFQPGSQLTPWGTAELASALGTPPPRRESQMKSRRPPGAAQATMAMWGVTWGGSWSLPLSICHPNLSNGHINLPPNRRRALDILLSLQHTTANSRSIKDILLNAQQPMQRKLQPSRGQRAGMLPAPLYGCWFKSRPLNFQAHSLQSCLGRQQMGHVLGPLHPQRRFRGCCGLLASAVVTIWGGNLWVEYLALSNSTFQIQNKCNLLKIQNTNIHRTQPRQY